MCRVTPSLSSLRVMSFNIRGAFRAGDGINAWPNRAALNVATIGRRVPHLIGFQELQSGNLQTYRERLPRYGYVLGPQAGNGPSYEFNAIFFDPRRLEVLDSGGFWLSTTPERYSSAWRARVVRSANWVYLRCIETGEYFLHFNTHLDHLSRHARLEGSKLMLRRIAELRQSKDVPVLLTGDFNCPPGSAPYRIFMRAGFKDAYLAGSNKGTAGPSTFHGFGGLRGLAVRCGYIVRYGPKPRRIDWILLKDHRTRVRVRSYATLRDRSPSGIYPSDHYPVLAELVLGVRSQDEVVERLVE